MTHSKQPRINLERAGRGPTAEDLAAMPPTTAADWADAAAILPVDRDIFEEAAAKQRARVGQSAKASPKAARAVQPRRKGSK
jgi:hypothetical protein